MASGAEEGWLFDEGDYFKYFRQRGGGGGGGGGRLFEGRLLFEEIPYLVIHSPQGFSGIIYNTGWRTFLDWLQCSLQVMKGWVMMLPTQGWGDAPDLKWRGWSNGGKSHNPKKSPRHKLTPKKSHAKFSSLKSFQKALNEIIWKIETLEIIWCVCLFSIIPFEVITNLHIVLYTQKILAKFSYPNKSPESKILNPPKPFDHPCHLKSGVPPSPCGAPLCECEIKIDHYAGNYNPYSLRLVCGFL